MITVIGGSGFIGSRLCDNLKDRQLEFEIIDLNKSDSYPEKSKIADIRNLKALRETVTGDVVVNLAAVHRDDIRDKKEYYKTNVDGMRNLCLIAKEKDIRRIVFTSTVAVYGFAEPDTDEDGAIKPFNDYGKSKFEAEEILRAWHQENAEKHSLFILRPTVVFGEGNRGNVYNLLKQIASGKFIMIGNGRNRKSMAYVGNIAALLETAVTSSVRYQLCNYVDKPDMDMNTLISNVQQQISGKTGMGPRLPYWLGLLIGYLADLAALATGKSMPVSSVRIKKFCATTAFTSKASGLKGFEAPFTLDEALRRTIESEFISPDLNRKLFYSE